MAPLVVQCVTPGAKWYGTRLLMQDHISTQCYDVQAQNVNPQHSLQGVTRGLHWVGMWSCISFLANPENVSALK